MHKKIQLSLLLLSFLGLENINAIEFSSIGPRATAMGGVGVSNAHVSLAGYYNPALLAYAKSDVEVSLGGSTTQRDNGVGESYNQLTNSKFQETYERLNANPLNYTAEDLATLEEGKRLILNLDEKGVLFTPDGYFSAQIQNFGIGVYGAGEGSATANVDKKYDRLIVGSENVYVDVQKPKQLVTRIEYENSSLIYAVESRVDNVDATALLLLEVPLSYGYGFDTKYGDVAVGTSLKIMRGTTYNESLDFLTKDIVSEVLNTEVISTTVGLDLGVLYKPSMVENLRIGLVAKNLNSPSFDTYTNSQYILDPMVRLGISYDILESLEVAFDSDLTSNRTNIQNFETQNIGFGVNYHPLSLFNIAVGLQDNIASDIEGVIYSAGFGVGPEIFQFELAGQYASNTQTVEGVTYPTYSKVTLGFVSSW